MNVLQFSKNVCFSLLINETCVCDIFSDHPLNTDTRIIQTLWHVSLVSMLTRFHCTSFTSVIDGQVYSLVIVSEFETLAILANYICFTRWCPQNNHLK